MQIIFSFQKKTASKKFPARRKRREIHEDNGIYFFTQSPLPNERTALSLFRPCETLFLHSPIAATYLISTNEKTV